MRPDLSSDPAQAFPTSQQTTGQQTWPANGKAGVREWTEYAVRYDAPAEYAGLVAHLSTIKSNAEQWKRDEERHPAGGFACTVVERTVTCSEWVSA